MSTLLHKHYELLTSSEQSVDIDLEGIDLERFTHLNVNVLSVPKTYYMLPSNAALYIDESGGSSYQSITIQLGNYSRKSLADYCAKALTNALVGTYSISYPNVRSDRDTGHYTISVTGLSTQPTIYISDKYLAQMLGFEPLIQYTFASNSLTSANVVQFQTINEILLKTDLVANPNKILQELYPAKSKFNETIIFRSTSIDLSGKRINPHARLNRTFRFWLVDQFDDYIDLNGGSWSMVLMFYMKDTINDVIKKYISFRLDTYDTDAGLM